MKILYLPNLFPKLGVIFPGANEAFFINCALSPVPSLSQEHSLRYTTVELLLLKVDLPIERIEVGRYQDQHDGFSVALVLVSFRIDTTLTVQTISLDFGTGTRLH